jgi:hypothetical protein
MAIYGTIILLGCLIILVRRYGDPGLPSGPAAVRLVEDSELHYVAARQLPKNHQLADADLRAPLGLPPAARKSLDKQPLVRQWLRRDRNPNVPILPRDVSTTPVLADATSAMIVAGVASGWTSRLIDAGSIIDLVSEADTFPAKEVVAVQCDDNKQCSALVRVSQAEATALAARKNAPMAILRAIGIDRTAPAPAALPQTPPAAAATQPPPITESAPPKSSSH